MIETITVEINRKAIIGFITALLALVAMCAGILPLPFTILLCYPPGIVLGIIALILGFQSQREIRQSKESGRILALLAAWIGGLTIVVALCMVAAGVLAYPYIVELIRQARK